MASSDMMTEQQVKDFIKSIITSNPLVSTIESIQKDYKEMIGTSIPYYKFKYNSVEHFLKSIPDTCVVQGTGLFAQVTLIPSQKSAHINKMVTQQKVNTKGRRKRFAPRRRNVRNMDNSMVNYRKPLSGQQSYNYSLSPNTSLSSSSSMSYISSGSQSKVTNNNTPNQIAIIKNTNVQNSAVDVKIANCLPLNNQQECVGTFVKNINTGGTISNWRTENTEAKRNYILEQNSLQSREVKEQLNNLIQQQQLLGNVIKTTTTSAPKNQETEPLNNSRTFNIPDNAPVLDKNDLRYLNKSNTNSAQECSKDSSDMHEDACFNKSKEKLNNLLANISIDEEVDEDTSNVPKRVQVNLKTLISQFQDGIWCSDVPAHYRKLFRKDLMYMEYGYTSLIEMCVALKHIFHYVRPGRDDFKLYSRSKPLPENVEKFYTIASYAVGEKVVPGQALPDLDWSDFKGHVPDDVFKYGNEIPSEFIPVGTITESIFDVVVVEIYDPSKFWFYLGTSDNKTALDDLMDSMQRFYNQTENAKDYAVPRGAIREGLYCVQVIYGEYHRARIVRVLADNPDYVRVFYIDYGTVCKVPVKGMCLLHSKFAVLNAQAIRCRLANIVPTLKGHPWPRTASDRFRELVNRRDTKIKISYIDWNEEYVCAFLADVTDKDNVVYINEVLVKEKHAVWDGETQVQPFVLSNFKCKVQNIHLFPTFLELEYGLAPNSSEMYALEELLTPLQFCIPQYFDPDEQLLSPEDESEIEQRENCFIETVKNHRKSTPLNRVDLSTVINPSPIDFDIFGDLKEEMIEFCKNVDLEKLKDVKTEDVKQEDEMFCDIQEETTDVSLEHYKAIYRDLKDCESLRLIKQDRELSDSIIEKLENYSRLDSEHSSSSESGRFWPNESENLENPHKSELLDLDLQEELLLSPGQIVEHELSTIFEQSETELDISKPESPRKTYFAFGLKNVQSKSDINIFDNPEEFERTSDTSEKSESEQSVTPESFLRTVEKICMENLDVDNDVLEESYGTTENFSAVCADSENSFKFDINADLREAFKSFLTSKKRKPCTLPSDSSCEQSPNVSRQSEDLVLGQPEDGAHCEASFLQYRTQNLRLTKVIDNVTEKRDSELKREERLTSCETDLDIPFKSNLEETRKSFVSTLSLNNPFRSYLDVTSSEHTDHLIGLTSEDENNTEKITNTVSESTLSSTTDLFEDNPKLKNAEAQTTSTKSWDSDGSDYKVFVPRNSQSQASIVPKQENLGTWVQGPMVARGMGTPPSVGTPPRIGTPPRLFTPPGCMPVSYSPYPQWSNGGGYPVSQYTHWSNGAGYSAPFSNFQPPRETVRPPPGFAMQCPPQGYPPNFNPYMGPRMPPVYPHPYTGGPVYYGPPRHMLVPSIENDFYERYNENVLKRSK